MNILSNIFCEHEGQHLGVVFSWPWASLTAQVKSFGEGMSATQGCSGGFCFLIVHVEFALTDLVVHHLP